MKNIREKWLNYEYYYYYYYHITIQFEADTGSSQWCSGVFVTSVVLCAVGLHGRHRLAGHPTAATKPHYTPE